MPEKLIYNEEVDKRATEIGKAIVERHDALEQGQHYEKVLGEIAAIDAQNPVKRVMKAGEKRALEKQLPPRVYTKYPGGELESRPFTAPGVWPDAPHHLDALKPEAMTADLKRNLQTYEKMSADQLKQDGAALHDNAVIEANMDFVNRGSATRIKTSED